MTFAFHVANPKVDPPILRGYDVLIRIEFDFALIGSLGVLWSEPKFTAIELAYQLTLWRSKTDTPKSPFTFESADDERKSLIWLRPAADSWLLGTADNDTTPLVILTWTEVSVALDSFVTSLRQQLQSAYEYDPMPLITGNLLPSEPVTFRRFRSTT